MREIVVYILKSPQHSTIGVPEKQIVENEQIWKFNIKFASDVLTQLVFRFGRVDNQPMNYDEYLALEEKRKIRYRLSAGEILKAFKKGEENVS